MSGGVKLRVPVQLHRLEAAPCTQTWTLTWHPTSPRLAVLEHERARGVPATGWYFPRRLLGDGQVGPACHGGFEALPCDSDWMAIRIDDTAAVLPIVSARRFLLDTDPDGRQLLADPDGGIAEIYRWLASRRCPLCLHDAAGQCRRPACLAESHRADGALDTWGEL